jgi:homoserine/homoserine lactone efflux protein
MDNWFVYAAVVTLVVFSPGPMTLFALTNAISYGRRIAIVGILGGSIAYIGHLLIVYESLAAMSALGPDTLKAIRILGGAYFLWLAFKQLKTPTLTTDTAKATLQTTAGKTWVRGFMIAATNPKAILFFAALFPQFIQVGDDYTGQFLLLAITYLVIQFTSNLIYGYFGIKAFDWIRRRNADHIAPKIIAAFLASIGILMII